MTHRPPIFLAEPVHEPVLALFGKHPLAADHLEDIGLSTPSLVGFKQGFYIEGISECLGKQAWFKDLGETDSIPYDHNLLCVGPSGLLAARIVHSVDAAGRKQYPLVLALHSSDFKLLHQVGVMAANLEDALETLRQAPTLTALGQIHAKSQKCLLDIGLAAASKPPPTATARDSWLQHLPPGGEDRAGLWRCCHALLPEGAGAGRARLPIHAAVAWPSVTLWASFLRQLCGATGPLTFVWRQGRPFADAWLTPPGTRILASMFADESAQPLTTQVPFAVPDVVQEHAQSVLEAWRSQDELFTTSNTPGEEKTMINKVCKAVLGWFK